MRIAYVIQLVFVFGIINLITGYKIGADKAYETIMLEECWLSKNRDIQCTDQILSTEEIERYNNDRKPKK